MRLYRLLAITIILINKSKITAGELAEKFEVSKRTIYRDLETINMAGIPLVSFQGAEGGYSVMENYKLDKNIFTSQEILSIITALEGLNSTLDDQEINNITEKIKTLFPEEKNNNQEELIMDLSPWGENRDIKNKLDFIKKAINNHTVLDIKYLSAKKEITNRKIEPLSLVLKGTTWYLYAYCKLRNDYRIFRLSRIKKLTSLAKKYTASHTPYREFKKNNNWDKNADTIKLELLFKSQAQLHIQDYFSDNQIEEQKDSTFLVKTDFPKDNWIYGFILSFGDMVEVLNPPHIKNVIQETAKNIADIYNDS